VPTSFEDSFITQSIGVLRKIRSGFPSRAITIISSDTIVSDNDESMPALTGINASDAALSPHAHKKALSARILVSLPCESWPTRLSQMCLRFIFQEVKNLCISHELIIRESRDRLLTIDNPLSSPSESPFLTRKGLPDDGNRVSDGQRPIAE
jgi:hypothetical protein